MFNLFKFIALATLLNFTNASIYDDANIQTLSIKYFNNSKCHSYFTEMETYTLDCYFVGNYDQCCSDLMSQHALEKGQELETCYLNNLTNQSSYYYECSNSGYYVFNYVALWALMFFILAIVGCLVCATGGMYYNNRNRYRHEYTPLNK